MLCKERLAESQQQRSVGGMLRVALGRAQATEQASILLVLFPVELLRQPQRFTCRRLRFVVASSHLCDARQLAQDRGEKGLRRLRFG